MKQIIAVCAMLTLTISSLAVESESPSLRSVMLGLGSSMDLLNQGVFSEDFKKIEAAAATIANHPKPKTQLPLVVKTLGKRMIHFKNFDSKVHNSAASIVQLAKKKDMQGILKKHTIVMNNCVACHTQFRGELSKALAGH